MKTFTIDAENNITTHASAEEAAEVPGTDRFNSAAELSTLAANWPGERLVEIWNSLPGATAVKKFKDRKTAIARIQPARAGYVRHVSRKPAARRQPHPVGAPSYSRHHFSRRDIKAGPYDRCEQGQCQGTYQQSGYLPWPVRRWATPS